MAHARLDLLPKELLAHIACCAAPSSVLRLGSTCRSIRSACYDSLVFKDVLTNAQRNQWKQTCLDIEAIEAQASDDAATWARFAIADERAWNLAQREHSLESPKDFINYLPELFVVKHPFMYDESWKRYLRDRVDQKPSQVFCLAFAILAQKAEMPKAFEALQRETYHYLKRDDSTKAFLWALCTIALTLRVTLKTRLAAWPYNDAANVPHLAPPTALQIPLRPLSSAYSLPVPFSRRAVELLGSSRSAFSHWDSWYRLHSLEALRTPDYLTKGTWNGYYIHLEGGTSWIDPPMINIHFNRVYNPVLGSAELVQNPPPDAMETVRVYADDGKDGVDDFTLSGAFNTSSGGVQFLGRKQYKNTQKVWDWDCRLTPFGLVGFWGTRSGTDGRLHRYGMVWLWKKEWAEAA